MRCPSRRAPASEGPGDRPRVGANDPHRTLRALAKAQFSDTEHPVDNVIRTAHAITDEVRPSISAGDEQWRRLTLRQTRWHLDIDLAAIVEGAQRTPRRIVALDPVPEVQIIDPHSLIGHMLLA